MDLRLSSESKETTHVSSQHVSARALYSASAKDREIIYYFLHFQLTRDPPSMTQYQVKDCLDEGQLAQSASQYA